MPRASRSVGGRRDCRRSSGLDGRNSPAQKGHIEGHESGRTQGNRTLDPRDIRESKIHGSRQRLEHPPVRQARNA